MRRIGKMEMVVDHAIVNPDKFVKAVNDAGMSLAEFSEKHSVDIKLISDINELKPISILMIREMAKMVGISAKELRLKEGEDISDHMVDRCVGVRVKSDIIYRHLIEEMVTVAEFASMCQIPDSELREGLESKRIKKQHINKVIEELRKLVGGAISILDYETPAQDKVDEIKQESTEVTNVTKVDFIKFRNLALKKGVSIPEVYAVLKLEKNLVDAVTFGKEVNVSVVNKLAGYFGVDSRELL